MAKAKAKAKTKTKTTMKLGLDVMSITVLLVIALFGGVLGYYIGETFGVNQTIAVMQTR